jgi:mono/diheme cytochrome c family protein
MGFNRKQRMTMITFLFFKRRMRARLIGASVLALACGFLSKTFAQSVPDGAGENSIHIGAQERQLALLAATGLLPAKANAGASGETNQPPTYLRDVLPIFMGKCSRCHNEQARFVYNWLDYKTAFADRWEIRRRIWDSWRGSYYKESMPISNSPESLAITDEERLLIRNWVASGGPRGERPPPGAAKTKAEKFELGRRLFTSICAACHQPTGQGVPNVFPPLAGSDFLNADKLRAIKTVINGRQGEVVVNGLKFNNSMPQFPLGDEDIANVLTFVYNSFGNSGLEVNTEEVKLARAMPADVVNSSSPPPPAQKNPFD